MIMMIITRQCFHEVPDRSERRGGLSESARKRVAEIVAMHVPVAGYCTNPVVHQSLSEIALELLTAFPVFVLAVRAV